MYRFAFRGRWLVGHLVVLAVAALFVRLGFWQLDRLDEVRTRNALVESRRMLPTAPLDSLLRPGEPARPSVFHRRVTVTGAYDAGREVTVRFRSLNGQPGEYLLTPLVEPGGGAVLVNRGWVPSLDGASESHPEAAPPSGRIRVTGWILPGEERTGLGAADPATGVLSAINRIDVDRLRRQLPYEIHAAYLQLVTQQPAQPQGLPVPLDEGDLSDGPHLSYAIQWFLFAAIGLVGWPLLIRRSARERAPQVGAISGRPGDRSPTSASTPMD